LKSETEFSSIFAGNVKGGYMKVKRITVLVLIAFLCVMQMAWAGGQQEGAAKGAEEQVTLRFVNWASAEDATRATINECIAIFEKQNPNIKIENIPVPFGQISQQAVTMAAGGNPADIIQQEAWMPYELAGMGELENLENYASEEYLERVWPSTLEASRYNDKLIAVPWSVTPFGFWYNKKLLKDAGIDEPAADWSELLAHLDILKEHYEGQNVDTLEVFTAAPKYSVIHGWTWMWAFGATPLENGRAGIDTPEFKETLAWYRKMVNEGYTTGGWKLREFREAFAKDQLVYAYDGPYIKGIMSSIAEDMSDEEFNETYGVARFPFGKRENTAMSFHQLAMSNKCADKEAAWKFIEFLTSSETVIEKYILPMGAILPLKDQVDGAYADEFSDPADRGFVEEVLPYTAGIPFNPKYSQAAETISTLGIQKACFTNEPIDKIVAELEQEINKIYGW
jgi:multiple sugar transport system substrate-binding protein